MNNHQNTRTTGAAAPMEPVFLVQENDILIAEDIMGSLQSLGPCRTIYVQDPNDVGPALANENRVMAAFIGIPYTDVLNLNIDTALKNRGAKIILTVGALDEQNARGAGWGMLVRPFTDQMIQNELAITKS